MKVNPIPDLIAFAIGALSGYGFFTVNSSAANQLVLAVGSGLTIFLYLGGLIAMTAGERGDVGNIRALSIVFLVLTIISNIIFTVIVLTNPAGYIIVNGILLLLYILIAYGVNRALT